MSSLSPTIISRSFLHQSVDASVTRLRRAFESFSDEGALDAAYAWYSMAGTNASGARGGCWAPWWRRFKRREGGREGGILN